MDRPADVEPPNVCARCGEQIRTDEWHPITTGRSGNRLYAFCSEECYESWSGIDQANG